MKGTIKQIIGVKPWESQHGIIYYHSLEMEDGKKLNIGKQKENAFTVGEEIYYEVKGEPNKGGFIPAKTVKPEYSASGGDHFKESAVRTAITNATHLVAAGVVDVKNLSAYADRILEWMLSK